MRMKASIVLNIVLLSFLLSAIFVSATTSGVVLYDPLKDLDDDGDIDIFDVTLLTSIYGSEGTPVNKTALLELQSRIENLEARIRALEDKPQIKTVSACPYTWTNLTERGNWTDLISLPNVTVSEGANVIAITSAYFKCMGEAQTPIAFRCRGNDTYGEQLHQGFTGEMWVDGAAREMIAIHHVWINLTAGTYTFAFQYWLHPNREIYVASLRLTLIIT